MGTLSKQQTVWIDVFRDTFCDLCLLNNKHHLLMADPMNDRQNRCIALHTHRGAETCAASQAKGLQTVTRALRIFSGTEMEREIVVRSNSTALADLGQGVIAVAGGEFVYYFKGKEGRSGHSDG